MSTRPGPGSPCFLSARPIGFCELGEEGKEEAGTHLGDRWGREWQTGGVEGKGADGGYPLEARHLEEPGQCEEHSQRQHWFLPPKDGHSQCQSLLWARHRARLEIPGPGLCGNPREGDTFSNHRRQPCPWTDTQKELPKPQTEAFGGSGADGRRLEEAI